MTQCANLATQSDIQAIMGAINALAAKIPSDVATASHIAGLESQIAQLTARVQSLESQLSGTESELAAIRSEQASQNGLLSNIPNWLEGLWGRMQGFFDWVGEGLSNIGSAIAERAQWVWDKMQGIGEWIWDGLRGIGSAIAEKTQWVWDKVQDATQWVWDKVQNVGEWVWDGLRWIFNKVGDATQWVWDKVQNVGEWVWDGLRWIFNKVGDATQWVWDKVQNVGEWVWDGLRWIFNKVGDATQWVWDKVDDITGYIADKIGDVFGGISVLNDRLESGINRILSPLDYIKNWVGGTGEYLNQIAQQVWDVVTGLASAIADRIWGAVQWLWEQIFGAWGNSNPGGGTGTGDFTCNAQDVDFADITDDLQYLRDNIDRLTGFVLGGLDIEGKVALNPEAEMRGLLSSVFSADLTTNTAKDVVNLKEMLLAIAAVIYGRAGYQDYPISVPALPLGTEAAPLQIVTASRFNSWQTRFIDHGIGAFPFTINIEDSDLIKVGNQPIEARFPNIAETLAEMSGLLITTKALSEANIEIALRTLGESGSARKQGFVHYRLTEAIASYLGFKTKQKKEEINLLYNPLVGINTSKDSLTEALKPTTVEVATETDGNKQSLAEILTLLIESARIIKAVNFRKVKDDGGTGLRDLFTADNPPETGEPDEFDKFIEEFEQGFIQRTNITDNINPYGRNFERRPRVKELGDQTDLTP